MIQSLNKNSLKYKKEEVKPLDIRKNQGRESKVGNHRGLQAVESSFISQKQALCGKLQPTYHWEYCLYLNALRVNWNERWEINILFFLLLELIILCFVWLPWIGTVMHTHARTHAHTHTCPHTRPGRDSFPNCCTVLPAISLGSSKHLITIVKSGWYVKTAFSGQRQVIAPEAEAELLPNGIASLYSEYHIHSLVRIPTLAYVTV